MIVESRNVVLRSTLFAILSISVLHSGFAEDIWTRDLDKQRPSQRPALEARYNASSRDAFLIEAERYSIQLDLRNADRHAISKMNASGQTLFHHGHFTIQDTNGKVWNSLNTGRPSRINLYRRGPYYNEIHWLDIAFTDRKGKTLPVRGEVVFYSYAESCRIGLVLHATEAIRIEQTAMILEFDRDARPIDIPIPNASQQCIAAAGKNRSPMAWFSTTSPQAAFTIENKNQLHIQWGKKNASSQATALTPGQPLQFDAGFIVLSEPDRWDELQAELEPLDNSRLDLIEGLHFKHDPRRGDYVVSTHNPGGFSYHYYKNRNDYRRARIRIQNTDLPRKIYLRQDVTTGTKGQVECGVVLDANNELLPITVQISKNFAGEKEEKFFNPKDTPFSETFVPLHLDAEETCELVSLQLYQDWGNHPLKQFSSLGAWMDYFHMSTGVTETTCYVPFKYHTGISIADLRGMSGRMWESQPQHDNVGGHIFMEYQAADRPGKRQAIEYLSTSYHSTGPNWAHITFEFLSTDKRVLTQLETFEYAQLDELRNFIRLRVKALEDAPIDDWAKDFRIMQIDTHTQHLRYQKVTYIDRAGKTVTKPIAFDDSWTLAGEPMSRKAPAAVLWNSPKGNNAFVIERWRGTIGSKPLDGLAVSCEGRANGESNLVLVPQSNAKGLVKGDEFEIDLFIMPFGKKGDDHTRAFKERERYGLNPVRISDIRSGDLISHFPPRIRRSGKNLQFTIQGGYATVGVLVEGLETYKGWRLEQFQNQRWTHLVHHNPKTDSGINGEGQQRYVCDDGSFGVVFRTKLDGTPNQFRLIRQD